MECSDFRRAGGKTWLQKAKNACTNCSKCKGNFPVNPKDVAEQKVKQESDILFNEIAAVILDQNAGFNFAITDLTIYKLVIVWREYEKQIKEIREFRRQQWLRLQLAKM